MVKAIKEEDFDPKIHVREYKRKCNECGKVWHSLVDREEMMMKQIKNNSNAQAAGACAGLFGASQVAGLSANTLLMQLIQLKKCPKCGSQNYTEKIIIYEKK